MSFSVSVYQSKTVLIYLSAIAPEHLTDKCWIYFPEKDNPFYRVTVFSNYSPNNVPDINCSWSLMCEVSESPMKKVNHDTIMEEVIQGALNTKLIKGKGQISHTWYKRVEKGYPTPGVTRNQTLFPLLTYFKEKGILSRGRFGTWRYEVGNMDHSFMQGKEAAEAAVFGSEEMTLWFPEIVNAPIRQSVKNPCRSRPLVPVLDDFFKIFNSPISLQRMMIKKWCGFKKVKSVLILDTLEFQFIKRWIVVLNDYYFQ